MRRSRTRIEKPHVLLPISQNIFDSARKSAERESIDEMEKIYRRPAVQAWTGLSRSSIYDMISKGTFPKPVRIGKRAVGWTEKSLNAWLDSRTDDLK